MLAHALAALVAPLCVRAVGRNAFVGLALVPLAGLEAIVQRYQQGRGAVPGTRARRSAGGTAQPGLSPSPRPLPSCPGG